MRREQAFFYRGAAVVLAVLATAACLPTAEQSMVQRAQTERCEDPITADPRQPLSSFALEGGPSAAVATLGFSKDGTHLIAVYADSARQAQGVSWDLATATGVRLPGPPVVHPFLSRLSANGEILVTLEDRPAEVEKAKEQLALQVRDITVGVVYVWDLVAGTMVSIIPMVNAVEGLDLSPDGTRLITVGDSTIDLDSTGETGDPNWSPLHLSSVDPDYTPEPFVTTFDQTGNYFAYGFKDGEVRVERVISNSDTKLANQILWGSGGVPVALAFDPTAHFLAILRTTKLELRNLDSPFVFLRPARIVHDLPPVHAGQLKFSPHGTVLAVGTAHGWQLRRTSDLSLVAEQQEQSISSLAFSDDGCLVAFGTTDGLVEVWAVADE
jgi:WD40 repeat protein